MIRRHAYVGAGEGFALVSSVRGQPMPGLTKEDPDCGRWSPFQPANALMRQSSNALKHVSCAKFHEILARRTQTTALGRCGRSFVRPGVLLL